MNDEHDRRYLNWIKESIERIYAYSRDHPGALLEDGPIRDAIVWRLETIGEATGHLSEALKARHPPRGALLSFTDQTTEPPR